MERVYSSVSIFIIYLFIDLFVKHSHFCIVSLSCQLCSINVFKLIYNLILNGLILCLRVLLLTGKQNYVREGRFFDRLNLTRNSRTQISDGTVKVFLVHQRS